MTRNENKRQNNRSTGGFTMAEMMLTVAVLAVLLSLVFVGILYYLRGLQQLQNDAIAKEIFVAAQNHLSAAEAQDYLENARDDAAKFGTAEAADGSDSAYVSYFIVNAGTNAIDNSPLATDSVLFLMLPFGSIDETVRAGGNYIIRYNRATATVMDVFYAETENHRFGHNFMAPEYTSLMPGLTNRVADGEGEDALKSRKNARRNYNGDVLGYYGGEDADVILGKNVKTPAVRVINGDRLMVEVTNPNTGTDYAHAELKLIITGKTSKNSKYVTLIGKNAQIDSDLAVTEPGAENGSKFVVVLDDITTPDRHFAQLLGANTVGASGYAGKFVTSGTPATLDGALIPGEDIEIEAVAFSTTALCNIARSAAKETNSLYGDGTIVKETASADLTSTPKAVITSIRHLENLDPAVSKCPTQSASEMLAPFTEAGQTTDLSWTEFASGIKGDDEDAAVSIYYRKDNSYGSSNKTTDSCYFPVTPVSGISYDGGGYSVIGLPVRSVEETNNSGESAETDRSAAGMFSVLPGDSEVKNLQLVDFKVRAAGAAGALAGSAANADITGVLVRNNAEKEAAAKDTFSLSDPANAAPVSYLIQSTGTGAAGGLIGSADGCNIEACAAAVYVNAQNGAAGGLIGETTGSTTAVADSYAGGHTENGVYQTEAKWFNVTASGAAGGFIGDAGSAADVTSCYATTSARGASAGGFAGTISGGSIRNSYATGLVNGTGETAPIGAFAGTANGSVTFENDQYFDIIVNPDGGNTVPAIGAGTAAAGNGIGMLDENTATYNLAADGMNESAESTALPYDDTLLLRYQGMYDLRTIRALDSAWNGKTEDQMASEFYEIGAKLAATHYGDWPSPEVLIINE